MLNLAVLLEDTARTVPDRDAVVHGTARLTYAELDAKAGQVAGALAARGIGATGKILKRELREPHWAGQHTHVSGG